MKKTIKRTIALFLCAVLICAGSIGAFAQGKRTDCGKDCEFYPTIIVPGLGQSNVWVVDDNGDFVLDDEGNKISSFPAYIQIDKVVVRAIIPALLSLLTQQNMGLSDAVADIIDICFGINASDSEGNLSDNVATEKYLYSVAECNEEERKTIYSHVPMNKYTTDQPEDHMYYFTYNSYGNNIELARELYDYIQMVKEQTGHSKVNLVPLSQGGTIVNNLMEYYPDFSQQLHKIIFVVPALDGSTIIGDVFNGRINFLDVDYLYNGFFGELGLLDEETARIIELLIRILPDEVLMECLEAACETLVESVMITSTNLWALCPSGDYPTAAEKYLSTPEMAEIRKQTDKYYQAQLNSDANIKELISDGVQVFCIAEYDVNMINVGTSWNIQNADYIIQLDSTSMGAYAANVGETLPDDYVQQNTNCKNPSHNHISPDRVVDASTGLLPDTTFYFDGQKHEQTALNDVILKLALRLIESDKIKDVYSSPDYPQFNIGRNPNNLILLVDQAKAVDESTLSEADAAEMKAAIAEAEVIINKTVGVVGEIERSEERVKACLVKAGVIEPEEEKEPVTFYEDASLWLYENYGTDGYSEIIVSIIKPVLNTVFDYISSIFSNLK